MTATLGILINPVKKNNISKEEALIVLDKLNKNCFRMSLELYKPVKERIESNNL